MTAEFGLFFLIIAFLTALLQASFLLPVARVKVAVAPMLVAGAWLQALCITMALALLVTLRLDSDFSVSVVAANSNLALPTLYKIAGTWGNHEGSMLLWVWVLAVYGACLAFSGQDRLKQLASAVQAAICAGFLLFVLATSNPFARQFPPPEDGDALNPILQDMALSIHPPLLYLGYVGFSLVFSLAVAALIEGKMTRQWAVVAHPWILASWSSLTLGIGLGSWWAYRVLGWGGFWFWDPVENASLMPWLCGTALLHSNIVLKKRGALHQWVLLLAIVTFAMSLLGTFLVRSGLLTSVHSFAADPARGFFILVYIMLSVGGALLLYALRAGDVVAETPAPVAPVSREGMVVINNLFLLTACATVMLGTLYPMVMEWWRNDRITVGAPYFNTVFLPLLAVPLVLTGMAGFVPWVKADVRRVGRGLRPAVMAAGSAVLVMLYVTHAQAVAGVLGLGLSVWLVAGSVEWVRKGWRQSLPVFLGHIGAALVIAGVTGASVWKEEVEKGISVGDSLDIAGYHLVYERQSLHDTENYQVKEGRFRVTRGGVFVTVLKPEYRMYHIRKTATSTASIHSTLGYDLYAVIGESSADGSRTAARIYYNPLVNLMWLGCVTMMAGGVAAWVRRRA